MSTDINIFELASRQKLRFASQRGDILTEQLWDLPLTSKTGFDLDSTAKNINAQLQAASAESFVATAKNPAEPLLTLMLEVVKRVIAVKIQENADRVAKADRIEKRHKLIELLAKKEDAALGELSADEIKKQLAALDD